MAAECNSALGHLFKHVHQQVFAVFQEWIKSLNSICHTWQNVRNLMKMNTKTQSAVVQRVDNAIQWIALLSGA